MADVFDNVVFEGLDTELEGTYPDHPHLVLFADPFLPVADPASLGDLRLLGGEELLFHGSGMLEEDEDDILLSALHDQGMSGDGTSSAPADFGGGAAGRGPKARKENRRRKQLTGVSSAPSRYRPTSRNAARERSRVKSLRLAFLELQNSLPSVPPNTKLSKLDVLVLATTYIAHLMKTLNVGGSDQQVVVQEDGAPLTMASAPFADAPNSCVDSTERHHRLHEKGYLHPVRKWPMRSRLYAGVFEENVRCSSTSGSALPALALPDINYSIPLLDANLNVLFAFPN